MPDVDATTARRWLAEGEAQIIDVREAGEVAAIGIPGARHAPLRSLDHSVIAAKPRKVVLVCASGYRSATACGKLGTMKGHELYSLRGGIAAWKAAGGPTEGSGKAAAPSWLRFLIGLGAVLIAYWIATRL